MKDSQMYFLGMIIALAGDLLFLTVICAIGCLLFLLFEKEIS